MAQYVNRISSILKGSIQDKKESIASIESLSMEIETLSKENAALKRQLVSLQKFDGLDEFTRTVLLDTVAKIADGSSTAEIKQFIDYLEIFEAYKNK